MEKKEILERAQKANSDEMERQVNIQSFRWIYITMVSAAAFFAFIRGMRNQPIMDLCATVSFSVGVGKLYYYTKVKDKFDLIIALVMLVVGIFATIRFFMGA